MEPIDSFNLRPGRILAGRYEVVQLLGAGWESEVYLTRERATGIERAAKLFFPQRNVGNKTAIRTARKLHELRHCSALIQYFTQETIRFHNQTITLLISELVEGELLAAFLARQPGKRLAPFEALHLLYALARGLETIHERREYHGDLHSENVLLRRVGLGFQIRFIDIYHRDQPKTLSIQDDVCDLIRLFYDALGGRRYYAKHRPEIKQICCGLKRTLILKKYRTAGQLARYLDTMKWRD